MDQLGHRWEHILFKDLVLVAASGGPVRAQMGSISYLETLFQRWRLVASEVGACELSLHEAACNMAFLKLTKHRG